MPNPSMDSQIGSLYTYRLYIDNACWNALTSPVLITFFPCFIKSRILTYPYLHFCFIICAFEFHLFLHLRRAWRYLTPPNLHKWRGASDAAAKPNLLQIFAQQIFAVLCTSNICRALHNKIFAAACTKNICPFCTKNFYVLHKKSIQAKTVL